MFCLFLSDKDVERKGAMFQKIKRALLHLLQNLRGARAPVPPDLCSTCWAKKSARFGGQWNKNHFNLSATDSETCKLFFDPPGRRI